MLTLFFTSSRKLSESKFTRVTNHSCNKHKALDQGLPCQIIYFRFLSWVFYSRGNRMQYALYAFIIQLVYRAFFR